MNLAFRTKGAFQKSCLTKRVWDPAANPVCWGCGAFIQTLTNRDVRGVDTMCTACMQKELKKKGGNFTTEKGGDA